MSAFTPRQQLAIRNASPQQKIVLRQQFRAQNTLRNVNAPRGNGNTRRSARRRLNMGANVTTMSRPLGNVRTNDQTLTSSPMFLSPRAANIATPDLVQTITFISQDYTQPIRTRATTLWLPIRPNNLGYSTMRNIYSHFRVATMSYRFVGIIPVSSAGHFYAGFSESNLTITNTPNSLAPLRGFTNGQSSTTTPWMTIINPSNTINDYLLNNNSDLVLNTNVQGYLHLLLVGATPATDTQAGTAHGHFEIRATIHYRGPIHG